MRNSLNREALKRSMAMEFAYTQMLRGHPCDFPYQGGDWGGPAKLVKSQLFKNFNTSLSIICFREVLKQIKKVGFLTNLPDPPPSPKLAENLTHFFILMDYIHLNRLA